MQNIRSEAIAGAPETLAVQLSYNHPPSPARDRKLDLDSVYEGVGHKLFPKAHSLETQQFPYTGLQNVLMPAILVTPSTSVSSASPVPTPLEGVASQRTWCNAGTAETATLQDLDHELLRFQEKQMQRCLLARRCSLLPNSCKALVSKRC